MKQGDIIVYPSGVYCVLRDRNTNTLKLVSLTQGHIYEYDEKFVGEYMAGHCEHSPTNISEIFTQILPVLIKELYAG